MIVDAATAERIGVAWLRAQLAPVGDFGRRAEDDARPFAPGDEAVAHAAIARVVRLAETLDREGVSRIRSALRREPDVAPIVSRARVGDPLDDVDFYELGRFADALEAIAQAWDAAGGAVDERPPTLPAIVALLEPGRVHGTFTLAAAFAAPLGPARATFDAAEAACASERGRLARRLAPALGFAPDGDEFIVMRDVVPELPSGVRVVRETPAYRTCVLELDAAALAAEIERDRAFGVLADAEQTARRQLAERAAQHGASILAAMGTLGELDRLLARVAFTQHWGGCVPTFARDRFAFDDARFGPLADALEREAIPYAPISLDLRGTAVLTGPNMGGKSAALALCGFLALCIAHGAPPIAARATLPLIARTAWIGGDEPPERRRLLSSFGAEVVRARDVLLERERPELVLVDEFARTTGPREGRALLVALVEALASRGTFALVATHFDGIARDAGVAHYAIAGLGDRAFEAGAAPDIHAALEAVARAMDYRIVAIGEDDRSPSDALEIAMLLGLDAEIVTRARALFE